MLDVVPELGPEIRVAVSPPTRFFGVDGHGAAFAVIFCCLGLHFCARGMQPREMMQLQPKARGRQPFGIDRNLAFEMLDDLQLRRADPSQREVAHHLPSGTKIDVDSIQLGEFARTVDRGAPLQRLLEVVGHVSELVKAGLGQVG